MLRRIVQVRSHEYLRDAWMQKSFGAAGLQLEAGLKVRGMGFVESLAPIPNANKAEFWAAGLTSMTRRRPQHRPAPSTYTVVANFEDEEAVARLAADRQNEVVGIYADLEIETTAPGPYAGKAAVGRETDVQALAKLPLLTTHGLTGQGVRVVIVDTGVDRNFVPVAPEGWVPAGIAYEPGTADGHDVPLGHGTMCAHDARLIAPQATFHDYALLRRTTGGMRTFLSDVLNAYGQLIDLLDAGGAWAGQPVVINNSWAVYNRAADLPVGAPGNYGANLNHPVNQQIGAAVSLGADVVFAAGNCGNPQPDARCGLNDCGPGKSIHGSNAHPDVITVAGVTTDDRRLAYSGQGPGSISSRKPDLAACTHFASTSAWPKHSGTSAAAPVLAGIVAALRTRNPAREMSPADLRAVLQRAARDPAGSGWNPDFGFGIVDVAATLTALGIEVPSGTTVAVTSRLKQVSRRTRAKKRAGVRKGRSTKKSAKGSTKRSTKKGAARRPK